MYGGDEFAAIVQQAKEMMDDVAKQLTDAQRAACRKHFVLCCKLEYMFFDAPWRAEAWPC